MKQLMIQMIVLMVNLHCTASKPRRPDRSVSAEESIREETAFIERTCFNDLYDDDPDFDESVLEKLFPHVFQQPLDNGEFLGSVFSYKLRYIVVF